MNKYLLEDWALKLKMLWLYQFQFRDWWREVALQESGGRMCCDGYMCGCYGSDYRSWWQHLWETRRERP